MNPLLKAIAAGYTADQIFGYMSQSMPSVFSKVQKARRLGYGANEILSYMANSSNSANDEYITPGQLTARQAEMDADKTQRLLGFAATVGSGAIGSLGAGFLSRSKSQPSSTEEVQQANVEPSAHIEEPQKIQSVPQTSEPPVEEVKSTQESIKPQQVSAKQLFDEMDVSKQIAQMASKTAPSDIAKVLEQHILKPNQLKWLKSKSNESTESLVNRFLQESKDQASAVPAEAVQSPRSSPLESQVTTQPPNQSTLHPPTYSSALDNAPQVDLSQSKDLSESEPKSLSQADKKREFTVGKHVMMPDGQAGYITDVKGDIAYVKVGDQVKTRKIEDLEESPLSDEEIGLLYDKLNKNLPKGHKSSHISYVGYDEDANELVYLPHGGELDTFKNIPKHFVEKLKNMQHIAKTSGNNLISAWVKGEESRGAGIAALISEIRASLKSEGSDKKVYDQRHGKVFSHHDYAHEASRRNEKKRKEREKAEARRLKGKL